MLPALLLPIAANQPAMENTRLLIWAALSYLLWPATDLVVHIFSLKQLDEVLEGVDPIFVIDGLYLTISHFLLLKLPTGVYLLNEK